MAIIAPSFLSCDIWRAAEQLQALEAAGATQLHLDVMDGSFVPNISYGAGIIKDLRAHSQMIFDVHLMVEEPGRFLADFAHAGADILTVHVEACRHLHRTLQSIRELGLGCGVAVNPATPLSALSEIVQDIDWVLLMSVNPGFGGQSFIPASLDKLQRLQDWRQQLSASFAIAVDGGVNAQNVRQLTARGADVLVAGSAVFSGEDCVANYQRLAALAL